MAKLLKSVSASIRDISYVAILVTLFIFIFAMLGYSLMAGKMMFAGVLSRNNFDSFYWSCITVYRLSLCNLAHPVSGSPVCSLNFYFADFSTDDTRYVFCCIFVSLMSLRVKHVVY